MKRKSSFFTSTREKRLWFWAFAVFAAIFSTLFIGQPLANQSRDQNVQAVFFVFGMLLIAIAVVMHGLKTKPSKIELTIILGIIAVYVMFIFRLGAPERSHLIEYSILTIFIHKALTERANQRKLMLKPAFFALALTICIGAFDETIQLVLPNRVFDPIDILFNGIAATMAIASSLILIWVREHVTNRKKQ
ncbi:VanZ family protein [Seonamhaeicola sp.]|uniref:VanZ family protein n=1 Tax=Seonamhaeicola sp. TaxID=1912245 RepID=UPI0026336618|nr:VanZ family protein [Seonamhaeicola sp.]